MMVMARALSSGSGISTALVVAARALPSLNRGFSIALKTEEPLLRMAADTRILVLLPLSACPDFRNLNRSTDLGMASDPSPHISITSPSLKTSIISGDDMLVARFQVEFCGAIVCVCFVVVVVVVV